MTGAAGMTGASEVTGALEVMGARGAVLASAPGRVELAGNHTDHQGGRVISAAIDQRVFVRGARNAQPVIRLSMDGFGAAELDLRDPQLLDPNPAEKGSSLALVRGMAAAFVRAGGTLQGCDLVISSQLEPGCGLSSSAAFEMAVGTCIEALCASEPCAGDSCLGDPYAKDAPAAKPRDPIALALAGVEAERVFFGKPCGAQDQITSACGGAIAMDFSQDPPTVRPVHFDAQAAGYALYLIDSKCDHSRFPDEFASIPSDMRAVARLLGHERLGEVETKVLVRELSRIRSVLGDRAALRALHFIDETRRVEQQSALLECGDFEGFLELVRLSGASSAQYLQSVSPRGSEEQPAMIILALCAHLLGERGAWRIHGGGFGGSVLAFVPLDEEATFTARMNECLGYKACLPVTIDGRGAQVVRLS